MILDKLSQAKAYRGIHPRLDAALDRLDEDFLATVGPQTMELEGKALYVTRFTYDTLPLEDTFFEAHKRYLDIHLMMEGEERVDIASPEGLTLFEQQGDFYAYRGQAEQSLVLRPGSFLVVFPEDAHRIKIQVNGPETVSKVVFKVLVYEE